MTRSSWRLAALVALAFAAGAAAVADQPTASEQLKRMLACIPSSANAVVRVDAQSVRSSPYAVREGWTKDREKAYVSGAASFPPQATLGVLASQMQPTGGASWIVSLIGMKRPIDFEELAKREDGAVDKVDSITAVISPRRQAYFLGLTGEVVGIYQPTNRQDMARWARSCIQASSPSISRYLQSAILDTSDRAQIVMAFDAHDILDPNMVKRRLLDTKTVGQRPAEIERLTPIVASIQGLRLSVRITDDMTGRLRLDFGTSPAPAAQYFKPLLLEVLENLGVYIADFDGWEVKPGTLAKDFKPGERSMALEGKLSDAGLRKLMALVSPQGGALDVPGEGSSPPMSPAAASLAYFKAVDKLCDDMRNEKAKHNKAVAGIFEKYADKLDGMPILNVDHELLDWGQEISRCFRLMAMSLRGTTVTNTILEGQKTWITQAASVSYSGGWGAGYGGYGGYAQYNAEQYGNNFAAINAQKESNQLQTNIARVELWRQIDDSTVTMRRKMTQKYGVEF